MRAPPRTTNSGALLQAQSWIGVHSMLSLLQALCLQVDVTAAEPFASASPTFETARRTEPPVPSLCDSTMRSPAASVDVFVTPVCAGECIRLLRAANNTGNLHIAAMSTNG